MHPQKVFTICGTDYTVIEKISSGGQGALYRAQNTSGCKQFAIKIYKVPSDPVQRNAQREYLKKSFQHNRKIAEASFQAAFVPEEQVLDEENGIYLELMKYSTDDCKTADEQIREWDAKSYSGLPRLVESVGIVKSLLNWLGSYHGIGLTHRDIKPANLFTVLKTGNGPVVFPIDFGSSCWINEPHPIRSFSDGYSHPELPADSSSIQRDLFGVAAVFVHLVMGKRAINEYTLQLLDLCDIANGFEQMKLEAPYGVKQKIQNIIKKTVEFEYGSAQNMLEDFVILLKIIHQRGIHREVLLDASRRELKSFEESVYGKSFDTKLLPGTNQALEGNILLIGPGGSGKTSLLTSIWKEKLESSGSPIPVYVSLSSFKDSATNWETFIQDQIIRKFFQAEPAESRAELGRLFDQESVLILLDGANESLNTHSLAEEVRNLLGHPGVKMIIPSRHGNIPWDCLKEFKTVEVKPLTEELVHSYLEIAGLQKTTQRLLETLKMPMFLLLFLKIGKYAEKYARENAGFQIESPGDILYSFRDYLLDSFAVGDHSVDAFNLRKCCLHQFLPNFAFCLNSMSFDSVQLKNALADMNVIGKYAEAMEGLSLNKKTAYFKSILVDFGLIRKIGEDESSGNEFFAFTHQNLMEFYKTLFVVQQIFSGYSGHPTALDQILPDSVIQYLADIWMIRQWDVQKKAGIDTPNLVSVEDWLQTHVAGKSGAATVVRNLLEVLKYQKQNQLQGICFDNLDFSESNFYHCNLEGATFRDAVLPGHAFISDFHRHPIDKLLIAPKTKKLITSARDETKLIVWNLDGNYLFTVDAENTIDGFDISFDEAYLAVRSGSFENSQIQIFSLDNGRRINTRPCESAFTGALFCFRPNTYDLLINTVKMGLREYNIFNENYRSVLRSVSAYTPDKSMLLTCVRTGKHYELGLYSSTDFQKEKTFAFESDNSYSFLFSYDGKQIWGVPMSPCEIKEDICPIVIDVETGTVQYPEFSIINHEIIGALKTHLFSSTKVWDYQTGKDVSFLYGYRPQTVHRVCFSDDGEYLGIIKDDCDVSVIHTDTLEPTLQFQATMRDIKGVCIGDVRFVSPDIIMRHEPRGAVDVMDLEDVTMIRLFTLQPTERLKICKTPRYIIRTKKPPDSFELWDTLEARCLAKLHSHLPSIKEAEYFPEEDKLVLIEGALIRGTLKYLPVAIHIYGVSDGSYTTKRYGDEQATALSAAEFIEKRIVIGMNAGKIEILNLSGSSLHIGKVHSGIIDRIVPVHKKPFFISCDKSGGVCVWNLRTLECMPLDGLKIDLSRGINVVLDYTEISPEALMRIQDNSDLSYTELEYPEGKLYWIMKDFFPEYCDISTTDRDVLLVQAPLGEVEAYWLPTGEVICFLDELRSHEQIASADISADGLRLAVIAENGKTEIYEREDLHSTSWRAIVWDVLDVDSIWGVDLTQAKLVCNDYIREQLRLNGTILSDKD